jgi:hypothetical protein
MVIKLNFIFKIEAEWWIGTITDVGVDYQSKSYSSNYLSLGTIQVFENIQCGR